MQCKPDKTPDQEISGEEAGLGRSQYHVEQEGISGCKCGSGVANTSRELESWTLLENTPA